MKRILFVFAACLVFSLQTFSQCPDTSVTGPGFFPPSDSLDCVERGQPWSGSIQLNLPSDFAGIITFLDITIDSIAGLPNGITLACDPSNCTITGGSSGCMNFSGTTNNPTGLYKLSFFVTVNVDIPFVGMQTLSGNLDSVIAQSPVQIPFLSNITYQLNVIDSGAACILPISVAISGNAPICSGDSITLVADVDNASGSETYLWSPGGETTSSIVVPDTGDYTVTVADLGDTVTASVTVALEPNPVASFTYQSFSLQARFFNNSTNATSVMWDFGDGNTSTMDNPSYMYDSVGTYTITLTATNTCGVTDSASQSVNFQIAPCSLDSSVTGSGVFPDPDAIPCIERGVAYDQTMQIINFDTLIGIPGLGGILVNYAQIDSIENLPCGITWESNKMRYAPGERGCIRVSGTSLESVGQYPLKMYMTLEVGLSVLGTQTQSGELNALIDQLNGLITTLNGLGLGFTIPTFDEDYHYVSRVIENGTTNCPARDVSATLVAGGGGSSNACPALSVDITADNAILCPDATKTLTATPKYYDGAASSVTYNWSTGETTSAITVSASGDYQVTVNDGVGSASDVFTVIDDACTSIRPVENNLAFDVYPNPSSGVFSIALTNHGSKPATLRVFDLSGKLVYNESIEALNVVVKKQLDLSSLSKGVYTLRVRSEAGNGIQKLTIY